MADSIKATGTLTQKEFAKFVRSEVLRRSWLPSLVLSLVFVPGMLLFMYRSIEEPERLPLLAPGLWLTFFCFPLVWVSLLYLTANRSARAQLTSSAHLAKPISYEFTDAGLAATSEGGSGRSNWEALHTVRETEDLFAFYMTNSVYNLVPKRMFDSAEDVRALRELIRSKLGSKAKLQDR